MMARKFPDWNDFKAKANGACRDRFEDLCRMLFCNELGIDQGSLVTIKNQPGNETELACCNGKKIGFQCKFFDHKLNLREFKDSISKAKNNTILIKKLFICKMIYCRSSKADLMREFCG